MPVYCWNWPSVCRHGNNSGQAAGHYAAILPAATCTRLKLIWSAPAMTSSSQGFTTMSVTTTVLSAVVSFQTTSLIQAYSSAYLQFIGGKPGNMVKERIAIASMILAMPWEPCAMRRRRWAGRLNYWLNGRMRTSPDY